MAASAAVMWPLANWAGSQLGGVPGKFIFAQWKMESGNFDSRLAHQNNFSGMKDIYGNWRSFASPDEFARAYVQLLQRPRYSDAYGKTDFWAWIKGLGKHGNKGGYYGNESYQSYGNKVLSNMTDAGDIRGIKTPAGQTTDSSPTPSGSTNQTLVIGGVTLLVVLVLVLVFSVGLQGVM